MISSVSKDDLNNVFSEVFVNGIGKDKTLSLTIKLKTDAKQEFLKA